MTEAAQTAVETVDFWIALPDGRRLAARRWAAAGRTEPAPAILEYLPYRLDDGTAPRDESTHPHFARRGYVGVRVDLAGSGASDGLFDDEYSEQELSDGEALIAWIADQSWCSGQVAMIGISWGGFNGLQLAARRPKALYAVASACSTTDRFEDDIHFMGGALLTDNFAWGAQMTAYMSRPPAPWKREDWRARWLERIDALPLLAADWQQRGARDAYWRHGSVCEDWSALDIPILAIGGWADAYVNAPLALAEQAGASAWIGPWEHKYPNLSRIDRRDFVDEVATFFDRARDAAAPDDHARPAIRAFIQDFMAPNPNYGPKAGRWVAAPAWPPASLEEKCYYPSKGGTLGLAPAGGETEVATSLLVGQSAAYFCAGMRVDDELAGDQNADDRRSVVFESAPLDDPIDILGRPRFTFAFRVDRETAQLCARLIDVAPDGGAMRVTYRVLQLNCLDRAKPEPLRPGKLYRADLPLNACGHRFARGHKIRLALSTSYWPVVWPSPEEARITLDLAQCALTLPAVALEDAAPARAIEAPEGAPFEILAAPRSHTEHRVEDGRARRFTRDEFGRSRDRRSGLEVESAVENEATIVEGAPLSAEQKIAWRFAFARGDWRVRIESDAFMRADRDNFHLEREIRAYEGDSLARRRRDRATVPRGVR